MDYLWLKSLHIAAVIVWIAGLLVAALTLAARCDSAIDHRRSMDWLEKVRRWDRRVTSPAMVLVWAFGLVLAMQGGWFPSAWLTAKLALVLVLSALHGSISGRLRRSGCVDVGLPPRIVRHAPAAAVGLMLAVVILVVVKPF